MIEQKQTKRTKILIMNHQLIPILAAAAIVFVTLVFMAIALSRYVKVGPNQVLIVSGRKVQLPDGRCVGFRMVKGGGTFVFPIIERADVLSLEVTWNNICTASWEVSVLRK
jgi:uncharacterized membrane protein YqiK